MQFYQIYMDTVLDMINPVIVNQNQSASFNGSTGLDPQW